MAENQNQNQNQNQSPETKQHQLQHIPFDSDSDSNAKHKDQDQNKGTGGLLSPIADPAGHLLSHALRPLGAPLEKAITGPLGAALGGTTRGALGPLVGTPEEKMQVLGGRNRDSYAGEERIAGREMTGGNPLGLDQSGRWGFEEGGKK